MSNKERNVSSIDPLHDDSQHCISHTHIGEIAMMSRRRFMGTTASAAGIALGLGFSLSGLAQAHAHGATPNRGGSQTSASDRLSRLGDFDGDGKTDFAVWRPSNGYWLVINSSNGGVTQQQWGAPGTDRPV